MALDLDRDGCITARDAELARAHRLRFAVDFQLAPGVSVELKGPEWLAHAADVLAEEILAGRGDVPGLPVARLLERRTTALRRLLDEGWDGLVRRADRFDQLKKALRDMPVKSPEGRWRVYVPARTQGGEAAARRGRRAVAGGGAAAEAPRAPRTGSTLMREPGMLVPAAPVHRPGRPLRADVRLGQLLQRAGRPGLRPQRARAGHAREPALRSSSTTGRFPTRTSATTCRAPSRRSCPGWRWSSTRCAGPAAAQARGPRGGEGAGDSVPHRSSRHARAGCRATRTTPRGPTPRTCPPSTATAAG